MQPASDGSGTGSDALRRYGPLAVIVVLLVGIGLVVVLSGDDGSATDDDTVQADAGGTASTGDGEATATGAPPPIGRMPETWAEAEADGTLDDHRWPETCDLEIGRVMVPSVYATPCVPVFEGDNGGATTPGVTEDTITIVRYVGEQSGDMAAVLGGMGVDDTPEAQGETLRAYLDIYANQAEMYGRTIDVVDYDASGPSGDVIAARADAVEIISEIEPFAVLGGPGLDGGTFAEALAEAGVICFECATSLPDSTFQEHAGHLWGPLPTANQFLNVLDAWVDRRDEAAAATGDPGAADNAVFAGDPAYHDEPRRLGVVHFEQDPPIFEETAQARESQLEAVIFREPYLLDFATMPEKAEQLMAKFKQENITSVVFIGDPFMPIYLTQAATDLEYFPEWVFTGTALTDTNIFGRQYDQTQMAHAYGISQVATSVEQDHQENIITWRWWFGDDQALPYSEGQYNLIAPRARFIVNGIHMAGPDLTPETFERGQFRIPPTESGITIAQVSFGNWGFFADNDYLGIDDSSEIWWDPDVEATDERGEMGQGVWRRSHGGQRFTTLDAPTPNPFDPENTITVLEEPPEDERAPSYPPAPGSPAAG